MTYTLESVQKLLKHFVGYHLSADEIADVLQRGAGVSESKLSSAVVLNEDSRRLLGTRVKK